MTAYECHESHGCSSADPLPTGLTLHQTAQDQQRCDLQSADALRRNHLVGSPAGETWRKPGGNERDMLTYPSCCETQPLRRMIFVGKP